MDNAEKNTGTDEMTTAETILPSDAVEVEEAHPLRHDDNMLRSTVPAATRERT